MFDRISVMNRARLAKLRVRDRQVIQEAHELFGKFKNHPLFIAGIALYWAEGTRLDKSGRRFQLALTNSDPKLLKFYCKFLKLYFKIIKKSQLRGALFLHRDINNKNAITYWLRTLCVPRTQFIKTQILPTRGAQKRKLHFGTCCVYVNSKHACLTM